MSGLIRILFGRGKRGSRKRRSRNQFPEALRSPAEAGGIRHHLIKLIAGHQNQRSDAELSEIRNLFRNSQKGSVVLYFCGAALGEASHMSLIEDRFTVGNAEPLLLPPVKARVQKCAPDLMLSSRAKVSIPLQPDDKLGRGIRHNLPADPVIVLKIPRGNPCYEHRIHSSERRLLREGNLTFHLLGAFLIQKKAGLSSLRDDSRKQDAIFSDIRMGNKTTDLQIMNTCYLWIPVQ